jgi:hypothetical protein
MVHHKNIAIFRKTFESIATHRKDYQASFYFSGAPLIDQVDIQKKISSFPVPPLFAQSP